MDNTASEINFDAIVGPTHNYAGLSVGNLASQKYADQPSNPRQAALQGLKKMRTLWELGFAQAVLPPQDRPDVAALRKAGFSGSDSQIIEQAARENPKLLLACGSTSAMWAANAATISPSPDTADAKVHFTPANMPTQFHRSLEAPATARVLRTIFHHESVFAHHPPLRMQLPDEGAANHMRLAADHGQRGIEVFVYGKDNREPWPHRFPARQTLAASQAIAHLHGLDAARTVLIRQNPNAIAEGVFHNDVAAVANLNVLLYHESAFAAGPKAVEEIRKALEKLGVSLHVFGASESQVPLSDALSSYLFNSQLLGGKDDMTLVAPAEAEQCVPARRWIEALLSRGSPVKHVKYVDVRQSMQNGGGPACLRLRVVLDESQRNGVSPGVFFSQELHEKLRQWIDKHYREKLVPADLADPNLMHESRDALDELTRILGLGPLYEFQRA